MTRTASSPSTSSLGALRRLSARQQEVLMWRYWFDESVDQTASRLGLTPSKVKDATHEATSKLRRLLPAGVPS